ncbi:hypothetical protein [Streptomyces sp. NPDC057623]|uniref:hypothetical protein n=1 Tax=Streptomyces sp. NPDC057623 TaxID=3346187 RepID=UPI0036981EA8
MTARMQENVVVLRFADRDAAYHALAGLSLLDSAAVKVRGAVLMERMEDGTIRVPVAMETGVRGDAVNGGLTGALLGVLGGPLGMSLGWGIGAIIASGHDCTRSGATAILAEVGEADTDALDLLAMGHDAILERSPAGVVRTELKTMEEAADRIRKGTAASDLGSAYAVVGQSAEGSLP